MSYPAQALCSSSEVQLYLDVFSKEFDCFCCTLEGCQLSAYTQSRRKSNRRVNVSKMSTNIGSVSPT